MVPRRRARKILKNSQLIFFIFKTLSQTFLQNILRDFQFFGKIEYWRYYTQKCTHMQEAVVKKKDTMTESTENIKKQSTHIFHFQNFVTDIFAKHFERFSIFWKNWILAILHPKMHTHAGGCGKKEGYHDGKHGKY